MARYLMCNIDAYYMRSRREQANSAAKHFAQELLDLVDNDAESKVLHNVRVIRTLDLSEAQIAPWQLQFSGCPEYNAFLYYNQSLLHLYRICWQLVRTAGEPFVITQSEMESEMARLGKNIMMSWNYAMSTAALSGPPAMLSSLPALWGYIRDLEMEGRKAFPNMDSDILKAWILNSANRILQPRVSVDADQLDSMANVLIGGPLVGPFVEFFSG